MELLDVEEKMEASETNTDTSLKMHISLLFKELFYLNKLIDLVN